MNLWGFEFKVFNPSNKYLHIDFNQSFCILKVSPESSNIMNSQYCKTVNLQLYVKGSFFSNIYGSVQLTLFWPSWYRVIKKVTINSNSNSELLRIWIKVTVNCWGFELKVSNSSYKYLYINFNLSFFNLKVSLGISNMANSQYWTTVNLLL